MDRALLHRSANARERALGYRFATSRERAPRRRFTRATEPPLRLLLLLCAAFCASCVDDVPLPAGSELQAQGSLVIPANCPPPSADGAPRTLECTGLYSDLVAKTVSQPVRPFTPGMHLWSDGAGKQRWLYLPPGTTIDNSKPYWTFPVGTRAWKEFKHGDQRVETRYFEKREDKWVKSTYLWRDGESAADIFEGGDVPVSDGTYHVPTHEECEQCHNRNKLNRDSLLGVEPILLGLPTADGYTLSALVAEGRLTVPPARTQVEIPDDGTGKGSAALGYLHVNCGISCHNDDGSANISHMFLRIYPAQLEDPSSAGWEILKNTLNVRPVTPNFGTAIRIVPGAPEESLIVQLANTRGSSRSMPPIASRVTDPEGLKLLRDWIAAMGGDGGVRDGGVSDGGSSNGDAGAASDAGVTGDAAPDMASDAGTDADTAAADTDAGSLDGSVDSGDLDAGSPAPTEDAGPDEVMSPDADGIDTATTAISEDAEASDTEVESAAAELSSDAADDGAFASGMSDADEPDGA